MAYEISNYAVKVTLVAGEDLSAKQYTPVIIKPGVSGNASDGTVISITSTQAPSDTDKRVVGILQNAPLAGQEAEVVLVGVTKIKTSDLAISAGEHVGVVSGPTGFAVASGAPFGNYSMMAFGLALTSAANGEIATVAISTPSIYVQGN